MKKDTVTAASIGRKLGESGAPVFAIVLVLVVWEAAFWALKIPLIMIVPPSMIVRSLFTDPNLYLRHTWVTVYETVGGFLLAAVAGVFLAVLIVYSRLLERSLYPILVSAQVVPKAALAPILLIWMGYGPLSKVAIAALIAFFPVVIDTAHGLAAVEPDMIDLARSNRATKSTIFTKIRLKHSLPYMFSGLKVGITLAIIGAIVGEFVGAQAGLGYLLTVANYNADTVTMFSSVIILTIIGLLLFIVIVAVERIMIRWYYLMRVRG